MAIIKCPECGHQISDKAETCPSCGVKIKDNVVRCKFCGEVYLKDLAFCPNCHQSRSVNMQQSAATQHSPAQQPSRHQAVTQHNTNNAQELNNEETANKKKKNFIIATVVAVIAILFGLYFFVGSNSTLRGDEETAYINAMNSSDPAVLQDYLDNFTDAPQEHIDSIQSHLELLKVKDQEWTNAVLSNSKSILLKYIENNPNSIHKAEALHKIDSLDWVGAQRMNTAEAILAYLDEHSDGEHAEEAQNMLGKMDASTVKPEERQMISMVFQTFFNGLNKNDEMGVTSAVSSTLDFLSNSSATKSDVITFLKRLYKDGVSSVTWRGNGDFKIQKKEVGDGEYEFDVEFTADEQVSNVDQSKDKFNQYRVKGHVDKDGKISKFQLNRIQE